MAANTSPIYSSLGDIQWTTTPLTAANTALDGTGTVSTVISASASGSFVQRLRIKASGSVSASVLRVFINNGQSNATSSNNTLFDEITVAAVTVSQTAASTTYELPMNIALPPAYRINASIGTASGLGGGWLVTAVGGSYLPM